MRYVYPLNQQITINAISRLDSVNRQFPDCSQENETVVTSDGNVGGSDSLDEDAARELLEKGKKRTVAAVQGRSSGIQVRLSRC